MQHKTSTCPAANTFESEDNDILASLDNKHCIILASLDLSAAFDTVDHTPLS